MEENRDVQAEALAEVVAGFAAGDYGSIECDQQPNGLWRVRAWPQAALDDEAE